MACRVLQVLPDLVPYGLERVVDALARLADPARFEVSIATLYADSPGSLAPALREEGIRVFALNKRRGLDFRMFPRLARVLNDVQPDLVHTHNYVLRYLLPLVGWKRNPLIAHTIHNVADKEVDRIGVLLQRVAFRRRVQPVVIAEEAAASFERVYGLPRPPLIPNGIDVSHYSGTAAGRERWRRQNGFQPDDLLFVCVARFFAQKNHRTLVDAFASGPAKLPNTYLLLAGEGHLQTAIGQQVQEARLTDRVRFLGRREDIPDVLNAGDVFALASLWEGNPLSVMEAMSAGLPSVVTAVGGVPELVESGRHGWVVPPADANALSAAMMQLAQNPGMRRSMGAASIARARMKFGQQLMVDAYESLYEELLERVNADGNRHDSIHEITA